jgi:hypothetical protein
VPVGEEEEVAGAGVAVSVGESSRVRWREKAPGAGAVEDVVAAGAGVAAGVAGGRWWR